MATVLSLTSTYAGEAAKPYIAAALLAPKSMQYVTEHLNINYKEVIRKYANAASFADETCTFTPTGTATITEISLNPKRIQWHESFCKKDFVRDWESQQMGASLHNQTLPPTFQDFTLERMAAVAAEYFEQIIWTGTSGTVGEFDGFIAQMTGGSDINATVLTAGNIIAELGKVVNAIPTAVKAKRGVDLGIYVPTSVIFLYEEAQSALGAADMFHERQATPNFRGIPLLECPGMPDNTMLAACKSNLLFGTSILSDLNTVAMIDMEEVNLDKEVRFAMSCSGDTAVGFRNECVFYEYQS